MYLDDSLKKIIEKDVDKFLKKEISEIIREITGNLESTEYDENSNFKTDLNFDSLDYTRLIVDAEDTFNIEIKDSENVKFSTPKEFKEYILKKIEQRELERGFKY